MTTKTTLRAGVQYDDYVGTAAADRADDATLWGLFEKKGYVSHDNKDTLVAIEFWSGENHGGKAHEATATITVANLQGYETLDDFMKDPKHPPLRSISIDMSNDEFFGYFKRFKVALAYKDFEWDRQFEVVEQFPE